MPEQVERDDGLDAGVVPQDLEFPRREDRVRLHDDGAGAEDREERDDEMRGVREEEGDSIPRLHADLPEARCETIDGGIEVPIGQRLPVEREGGPVPVFACGAT